MAWANLCTGQSKPAGCAEAAGVPLLANTSVVRILDLPDFPLGAMPPDGTAAAAAETVIAAVASTLHAVRHPELKLNKPA